MRGANAARLFWQFVDFHIANPEIYELFGRFVNEAIRANKQGISARLIIERVRWEIMIAITRTDGFRICNNHAPFYVRMYLREHPEHIELFDLRDSYADDVLPIPNRAV